ncbi:hypothetical protein ACP70R_046412 [Stipagrostis hirtigluma subsp. patula]
MVLGSHRGTAMGNAQSESWVGRSCRFYPSKNELFRSRVIIPRYLIDDWRVQVGQRIEVVTDNNKTTMLEITSGQHNRLEIKGAIWEKFAVAHQIAQREKLLVNQRRDGIIKLSALDMGKHVPLVELEQPREDDIVHDTSELNAEIDKSIVPLSEGTSSSQEAMSSNLALVVVPPLPERKAASTCKTDIHALAVSYEIKRLKQQLAVLEKLAKEDAAATTSTASDSEASGGSSSRQ